MTGGISVDKQPPKPGGAEMAWLTEKSWNEFERLGKVSPQYDCCNHNFVWLLRRFNANAPEPLYNLVFYKQKEAFKDIQLTLTEKADKWRAIYDSPTPYVRCGFVL